MAASMGDMERYTQGTEPVENFGASDEMANDDNTGDGAVETPERQFLLASIGGYIKAMYKLITEE